MFVSTVENLGKAMRENVTMGKVVANCALDFFTYEEQSVNRVVEAVGAHHIRIALMHNPIEAGKRIADIMDENKISSLYMTGNRANTPVIVENGYTDQNIHKWVMDVLSYVHRKHPIEALISDALDGVGIGALVAAKRLSIVPVVTSTKTQSQVEQEVDAALSAMLAGK